jgi:hypothetical protein
LTGRVLGFRAPDASLNRRPLLVLEKLSAGEPWRD